MQFSDYKQVKATHLQMSSFWKLKDGAMDEVSFYVPQ